MRQIGQFGQSFIGILAGILLFASSGFGQSPPQNKLTIAVATNFAIALDQIAQQYQTKTGQHVEIITGSTGKLYAQILQGAPFDVFLSADQTHPNKLVLADPTRQSAPFARGQLTQVRRIGAPALNSARIAIADPRFAPYGAAAISALNAQGFVPTDLDIIYGTSVAAAANFLQTGNVDIAFLAASQRFDPASFHTEIIAANGLSQHMVLLNQRAQPFFDFLLSTEVQSQLPRLGYLPPKTSSSEQTTVENSGPLAQSLWPSILLSLKLATVTTLILLIIGVPLAWWLTTTRARHRPVVETLTALPLVVPPTVLGFYFLVFFAPQTPLGSFFVRLTGETLTFSFSGLVLASVIYSLPFAVQPLHTGFQSVGRGVIEAAQTMGASRRDLFLRVILPLSRRGVLTAAVLSFAHTIGEFGVVLMVGGNLPGKTRVISIEIFNRVELLDYRAAHVLAGGLLAFSFVALLAIYALNSKSAQARLTGGAG